MADRFVQIRLETKEGDMSDGSFLPANLHVLNGDRVIWWVSDHRGQRITEPTADKFEEVSTGLADAEITVTFKYQSPFEAFKLRKDGRLEARVKGPPGTYHYACRVTRKAEVLLDVHCPEIIIQR